MAVVNPFDFFVEPFADSFPFAYPAEFAEELGPYLDAEPAGPRLSAFLASIPRDRKNTVDFLVELNQRLQRDIRYLIRMETGVQTPEATLTAASGSCRDSAWLLVQTLRHLGLAARFVSGYLIQLRPDVQALDGPVGAAQDFTDLHAWAEAYVPGAGWIGLDRDLGIAVRRGSSSARRHAAFPRRGADQRRRRAGGGHLLLRHEGHPRRREAARHLSVLATKPGRSSTRSEKRSMPTWSAHDVRLTMGGEPTFVSVDDYQSEEWNTAALGPTKRIRADDLIRRLRNRFAPGGFLHYGQGKWYPGEPLPRWAFALYWRRDGAPIWRNAELIATETGGRTPSADVAERFTQRIAARLGIAAEHVQPVFEDPAERLLKEGELAANIDPSNPRIDDPQERSRIMRASERRLGEPAGYVLPVQRWTAQAKPGWISELWRLRRGRLFLMPGDSPMIGFRLPAQIAALVRAGRLPAPGAGRSVR